MPQIIRRLTKREPRIEVIVNASERLREAMEADGQPSTAPALRLAAVIDTGATVSAIQKSALYPFNLQPVSFTPVHTVSNRMEADVYEMYEVWFQIADDEHPFTIGDVKIVGATLPGGVDFLIGCDVLSQCRFTYDGPSSSFSLTF